MISIGYVNNTLTPMTDMLFREYSDEINDIYDNTNNICYEMSLLEERVNIEQEITGSVDETLMLEYEGNKKNFFQKIGEAIITIFEKVRAAIQSAIDKVKEIAFGSKSDLQKLDALIKKHPELKDEVVCAFNSGALDMKDIKSLKELDSAFEEVMRMSKEKDIDPNTLKGKWEKAKKKFQEDEKTWNVSKIANVTKTVLTAGTVALTFGGVLKKNKDYLVESHMKNKALEAELEKRLRDEGAIKATDPSTGKGGTGKWTALLQINRELNGYHDAARMKNLSLLERMQNGVAKILDKFTSKEQTEKLFNDYDTERKINDAKKTQEIDDIEKKAEAQAKGSAKVKREYEPIGQTELDDIEKKAEAQAKGSAKVKREYEPMSDKEYEDRKKIAEMQASAQATARHTSATDTTKLADEMTARVKARKKSESDLTALGYITPKKPNNGGRQNKNKKRHP